jgi:hypothetical protein
MRLRLTAPLFVASFVSACAPSPAARTAAVDTVAISRTLRDVAANENRDFYRKDFAAWQTNFVHSDAVSWVCVEDEVTLRASGWSDVRTFVGDWMTANPAPDSAALTMRDTIQDFHAEIGDQLAFVRFKRPHLMPDGKVKLLIESRTFQRVDGAWKILGMTSAPGYLTPRSTPNVFTHNDVAAKVE